MCTCSAAPGHLCNSVYGPLEICLPYCIVLCNKAADTSIKNLPFLPRDAMRKRGLCCHLVSVCPSVRHVGGLYPDGLRYRQTYFSAQ